MSLKEALKAVMESRPVQEIVTDMKHMAVQGSHEAASALFRGDAYVMYPKAGKENEAEAPQHGLPEQAREIEVEREM